MSWSHELRPEALKDLKRLDRKTRERIRIAITRLTDSMDGHHRPLRGTKILEHVKPMTWRLRVSDWRVLFRLDQSKEMVTIILVDHRSRVYKRLT